jgi:hypothetical protein
MKLKNNTIYVEGERTYDIYASIVYKKTLTDNVYYKDTVLYIQSPLPINNVFDKMFVEKKVLDYVLEPPKNVKIPHCTKMSLLFWIYGSLLPKFGKEYNEVREERRKCRRKIIGFWLCCWSLVFVLLLVAVIVGYVVSVNLSTVAILNVTTTTTTTITTPITTTSPSSFSIECGTNDYYGDLEETSINNYTITGTGCGGSAINVTTSMSSIIYTKKRRTNVVPKTTPVIIQGTFGNPSSTIQHISPNITMAMSKKDIGVFPEEKQDLMQLYGTIECGTHENNTNERIVSSDGNNEYYIRMVTYCSSIDFHNATTNSYLGSTDIVFIFPPECIPIPYYALMVRYDHQNNRFVIATKAEPATLCIAVSDTSEPTGTWTVATYQNATLFQQAGWNAFEISVWGNYYTSCWMTPSIPRCVIISKSTFAIWISIDPMFSIADLNTNNLPAIHPITQGLSPSGSLVNCGAFAVADDQTQQLRFLFCTDINFDNETVVFGNAWDIIVNGGWISNNNATCNIAGIEPGCMPMGMGITTNALSNRVRVAYSNEENFAYVFPTNFTSLYWGELTLPETSITPGIITSDVGLQNFAPALHYDCYRTVYMSFTQVQSIDNTNYWGFTYHLRTDPTNQMRNVLPESFDTTGSTPYYAWSMEYPFPNTVTPRTGRFSMLTPENRYTGYQQRLQDQEFTLTYNATDVCGNFATCSQTIHLGTVTPCPG